MLWTIEWKLHEQKDILTTVPSTHSVVEAYRLAVEGKAYKHLFRKRKRELSKLETTAAHDEEEQNSTTPTETETVPSLKVAIPDLHFYLHRPNTPAKYKCIIPISQTETIGQAVQNRTLLEFPTLYVLRDSPEDLKLPFITESKYLEKHEDDVGVKLPTYGTTEPAENSITALSDDVDEKKVLEVLRKDIAG